MILVFTQILVEQSVVDMYQESSCSQSVVGRLDQAARRMEQVQNMRTLYEEILESLTSSSEDDVQKWNFIEKLEIMPIIASDSWELWCFLLKLQQHRLELSHISSLTWVIDCNMEPGYLVNPVNPHCVHFSTSEASCCFLCIIKQNKTWIIDVSHKVPPHRVHKQAVDSLPLPITIPNCRGEQRGARWDVWCK